MSTFYITTPIYYVNAEPHIGHAYTTIAADVLARYHRLKGKSVLFLTGVDEHGANIQKVADEKGIPPQEYCDQIAPTFTKLWQKLNISNDDFIRTTSDLHKAGIAKFFTKLYESGDIYRGKYEGHYCQPCERFYTEKELGESGTCPIHKLSVEKVVEENYFFALTKYQDQLIDLIQSNPSFIEPASRRNEIMSVLTSGLQDISISRSSVDWGIPLPFDPDQNIYVWTEALVNYITALDYHVDGEKFRRFWPANVHMMAKEITRFHVIIWPAMLMAVGLPLPQQIFAHGWLTKDGDKISKTLGNVIDMDELIEEFGLDPFRYFFMREFSFGNDGNYTQQRFVTRYNSDLANDLGNLLNRVLGLLSKNFEVLPDPIQPDAIDEEIKQMALETAEKLDQLMNQTALDVALETVWEFVRRLNRYIQQTKVWSLKDDPSRMGTILYNAMEALRVISVFLTPFMPQVAAKIQSQLGIEAKGQDLDSVQEWGGLAGGLPVAKGIPLFPKKDQNQMPQKETGLDSSTDATVDNLITIDQVKDLELRVGQIVSAELVPDSDRLLKLIVDLGNEQRQIVAGIARTYAPQDVIGKQAVLVANLQPAKIRGIESQGMLLAAVRKKQLSLVTVDQAIPNGTLVS